MGLKIGISIIKVAVTLLFLPYIGQADDVIEVHHPDQVILLGDNLEYLADPTNKLEIDDIVSASTQKEFEAHHKGVFSRPGTKSAIWFKFTVRNLTDEDLLLEVGTNYAWYIDLYAPDTAGNYTITTKTGTMLPDNQKPYDVNFFWLPLNNAHEPAPLTYYLRVSSGLTFELPLQIGTIRSLSKNKDTYDFLTAGFVGIILIMLIYNLFIYISTKDHIYLFYLGYLFIMVFSIPYANGYPFIQDIDILFFDKQFWNNYFLVWHNPAYYFIGTFCIRYLNLKEQAPLLRRLIQTEIIIISLIFPALNLLGYRFVELVNPTQVSIVLLYLTCLFAGYYFVIKGIKRAYFYTLGWTFYIFGAIVFFAVINGFLPYNAFTRNALYFGVAIEVCLFSLALANRLNVLRKEKEFVEQENTRLVREQNEMLEAQVSKRTEELQSANEKLIQTNEELLLTTEKLDLQSRELQEINDTKDRLFAIIGHDLRSPINSLKGLLNLMYQEGMTKKEFIDHSQDARQNVEHVHFMLNNLLNWAKFQLQGISNKPENIMINGIVTDNINLMNGEAKNKNIEITNNIAPTIAAYADPDQLSLIIRNLLSNAIKFTNTGGKIDFSAIADDRQVWISISDTGVGMSCQIMENIFSIRPEKTQQGTSGEKGTGIGLHMSRQFVEMNNGQIMVKSAAGKGTTFTVELPLSEQ
jgi:signal transduction histidine kinase